MFNTPPPSCIEYRIEGVEAVEERVGKKGWGRGGVMKKEMVEGRFP